MASKLERRQSFQTIAWFRDLHKRGLLDLDPPYQRRAVWNQKYRDFFVETILLHYPAPALFIHEDIRPDGTANYSVVDGKQRLTTIFDFVEDLFPVSDESILERHQGKVFTQLDEDTRRAFWQYQFSVEYLPTTDEGTLNSVFDRINRNVAKLTRQELRHARFDGRFALAAESMNDLVLYELPDVPRIAPASRRQMKDVELVAQLLLLVENGPQSFSQDELDQAYSDRDIEWEHEQRVESIFRHVVDYLALLFAEPALSTPHTRRLRNQADFYSLFGAVVDLLTKGSLPESGDAAARLSQFIETVHDDAQREASDESRRYYEAARSASNDLRQRVTRIEIIRSVLLEPAVA